MLIAGIDPPAEHARLRICWQLAMVSELGPHRGGIALAPFDAGVGVVYNAGAVAKLAQCLAARTLPTDVQFACA